MRRPIVTVGIVVVAVLIVAAIVYSFYRPASIPPESGPVATSSERAQDARDYIADLEKDDQPNYAEAVERAEDYQSKGQLADAQLLYFFAARNGNAQAAFELAQLYDPNHFEAGSSLMGEPDAFQAFKWYTAAKNGGVNDAQARLDALHMWAEKAAQNGDTEAERLLLQWQ
jgi:TPR repeat protein